MAAIGTMTVTVASEEVYRFSAYPWGTVFKPLGAVYIVTKRTINLDGSDDYLLIYVGYTDDLSACLDSHRKTDCFEEYGANCICVLGLEQEQLRSRIVSKIEARCKPACND
jgi:hypothetical protein